MWSPCYVREENLGMWTRPRLMPVCQGQSLACIFLKEQMQPCFCDFCQRNETHTIPSLLFFNKVPLPFLHLDEPEETSERGESSHNLIPKSLSLNIYEPSCVQISCPFMTILQFCKPLCTESRAILHMCSFDLEACRGFYVEQQIYSESNILDLLFTEDLGLLKLSARGLLPLGPFLK